MNNLSGIIVASIFSVEGNYVVCYGRSYIPDRPTLVSFGVFFDGICFTRHVKCDDTLNIIIKQTVESLKEIYFGG